ncbi:hypothetical protein QCE62_05665 [Caballeronia sp. LZ033]|uniref:hypothetical protein n=1 Tax=Caballeronia sp. LZ033 TaxID=3038566 RepID=UPI00285C0B6F|nr:hypothetical protein [Caballeronia sp. LZ033]MDR5813077.1 hypothetical protein [Caballeronia sp. LZ033]
MKRVFITAAIFALSACAQVSTIPDAEHWADDHRWELRSGSMTWVQFYTGIRNALGPDDHNPLNQIARKRADTMIRVAQAYEAGRISMDDMTQTEREQLSGMQLDINRDAAERQASRERAARVAAALNNAATIMQNQQMIDNMNRPINVYVHQY